MIECLITSLIICLFIPTSELLKILLWKATESEGE